ncbi:hypothetical protein HMPREF1565_2091 [Providencia alcalifaciens RIMD 1656011]|uniref:Uncharacterized protein n=1 Tax=Providencia alcalifaciens 205/92 TaxID=1256988 RepID=A0AAV3M453_9GAMM|nr:hypothetical protein HMPREF1562_2903 [Providencia alcalifaciens F90-2004]EUC95985.1 hypothetical protein HMPREF1567_2927 [Providencia alcalifaciens PAL-2]EUD01865.1 hypothetical protein HMPREF1565_2091 [Providencia alcalifaciens RIMD 1656011]EUD05494.1 hypothetical protein HMPREF1564_0252 [Providencia alcalifaciens R90-1475]EUD10355.1 hypothetical protein HMPREF1563_3252 [Providencia alcalifaciens 205/92]
MPSLSSLPAYVITLEFSTSHLFALPFVQLLSSIILFFVSYFFAPLFIIQSGIQKVREKM